jgi:glutathione synthase/RimK-type ligase-like ATP-grasp enzyme
MEPITDYHLLPTDMRIALATCARLPDLAADDRPLVGELGELGIEARPVVWDDPRTDWSAFDAVLIRSCWDYHLALDPFLAWVDGLAAARVPVWNPPHVIRWNADKRYLRDIQAWSVRIPETVFLGRGEPFDPERILEAFGSHDVVVKPAVSATAHRTARINAAMTASVAALLAEILPDTGALVQQYLPEVAEEGEWSLIFFDGEYSHAVLKRPRSGDFRVQNEFGGSAALAEPPAALVDAAARLVKIDPRMDTVYARVDCVDLEGELCLMELELIEPSLFLDGAPGAARRFARAIASRSAMRLSQALS